MSSFRGAAIIFTLGGAVAQLVPFIFLPILTRLYSVEDFGLFNSIFAFASIFGVVACYRYEQALMLVKGKYLSSIICISNLINIFNFLILLALTTVISLVVDSISMMYIYLPFIVFFLALNQLYQHYLLRIRSNILFASSKVAFYFNISVFQVVMFYCLNDAAGLIIGYILGGALCGAYLVCHYRKKNKTSISSKEKIIVLYKKNLQLLKFNSPSSLLSVAATNIPLLILPLNFGFHTVGIVALSMKCLQAPGSMISNSYSQAIYQLAINKSKYDVENKIYRVLKYKIIGSFVFLFLVNNYISEMFTFFFGVEWAASGEYSEILILWIHAVMLFSPVFILLNVIGFHREQLIINTILFLVRGLSILAPMVLGGSIVVVLISYTFVSVVSWLVIFVYTTNIFFGNLRVLKYVSIYVCLLMFYIVVFHGSWFD